MKPSRLESIIKVEDPVHIFVLVHGTWAASAEWIKAGSKLVASLLRTAKSDIRIDAFIWWGRNSPKRREYYAKELAKNLADLRDKHRTASITIVAHSHGGAVSSKALEYCNGVQADIRLVCLSTPFLHVRERARGLLDGVSVFLRGIFLVAGVVSIAPLADLSDRFHPSMTEFWVSCLACLVILPLIGFWLAWWLGRSIKAKGDELREAIGTRVSPSQKLLLLRMAGDEASYALSAYKFFDWLLERILFLWHSIDAPLRRRKQSIWEAIFMLTLVAAGLFALVNGLHLTENQGVIFLAIGVFVGPILALLSTILAVLLAMWSILPMGWSAAIGSLAQSVSVESSPLGSWPVELFMPVEPGLAHSKTYEDDRCLARIRQWCELSAG